MSLTDAEISAITEGAASGFRRCIVASPGCCLIEADYSGLEAVLTGYFANDPLYYRLAKLGVHANLASHKLNRPADLSLPDPALIAYFNSIKNSDDPWTQHVYLASKKTVHGVSYGLTPYGMTERMPEIFPTKAVAEDFQQLFFSLAPRVREWQLHTQAVAAKQHYLGGPGQHPFGYKLWLWDVHNYVRVDAKKGRWLQEQGRIVRCYGDTWYEIKLGADANRAVSFYPQSTGAAISRMCSIRLFAPPEAREEAFGSPDAFMESYIGDLYYGATPLRAYIYDSFVLEVPIPARERAITALLTEMRRPVAEMPLPWAPGEFVTLDAAVKTGSCWAPASDEIPDGMRKYTGETTDDLKDLYIEEEDGDEEEDIDE